MANNEHAVPLGPFYFHATRGVIGRVTLGCEGVDGMDGCRGGGGEIVELEVVDGKPCAGEPRFTGEIAVVGEAYGHGVVGNRDVVDRNLVPSTP